MYIYSDVYFIREQQKNIGIYDNESEQKCVVEKRTTNIMRAFLGVIVI